MTALLTAAVAGYLAGRLAWLGLRPALHGVRRHNHRGQLVITCAGVAVPVAVLLVEGGRAVAGALGVGNEPGTVPVGRLLTLVLVLGFGLLGALDDLLGDGAATAAAPPAGGFRGHTRQLVRGRVTTGALKLVAGVALAFAVAGPAEVAAGGHAPVGVGRLVLDAVLVAGCANLANLLDRRPGRAIKVSTAGFIALVVAAGADRALIGPAVATGAGLALAAGDLAERHMLGDAGANALGAVGGLAVVLVASPGVRVVVAVVVVALNVLSEVASLSVLIEAVPALRALDRAGTARRRSPRHRLPLSTARAPGAGTVRRHPWEEHP